MAAPRTIRSPPRRTAVTLRDVARSAAVHPATASRALNPETRSLVNEQTARRVTAVAEELGYRPNSIARGLKTNRSHTIGVLIPDITNPLFPPIVRGIEDGLEEAGYTPLIANTDNDPEREEIDLQAMRARRVDGFIAATARSDHAVLDEIVGAGPPVVLVNRTLDEGTLPAVLGDDERGVRLAVEHLRDLGHRQIAHLAGSQAVSTGRRRLDGFRTAMRELGLEPDEQLILFSNAFTEGEGARLCMELLDPTRQFTALVAGNDLMALGCYDVVEQRGLDCPRDVSIVGFNDMPFADRFNPPLTTIRIPHYEIGLRAAELLLQSLREPPLEPPQALLQPELVVRGSTAPASRLGHA
jgi:LacI family transcriptional regulator, galactose operon repressor